LKQRGVDTAVLGTSSENVAMQRLAASVGFRVESAKVWFEKQVTECDKGPMIPANPAQIASAKDAPPSSPAGAGRHSR
jgi:hypothetical protein